MDRIELLRVFLRVAEGGSFTGAADQLGLPRATVSLSMQQLEARLGVRLFHRTTRRVSLTQDGEALLDRAGTLVGDMEDLEQRFHAPNGAVAGRLRVDMPSRIARRIVAPALPEFLRRHPDVQVEVRSSDRAIDLVQEGVDCALRVGELPATSLVARPLGKFALVNCASPGYLAQHGTPSGPGDLDGHFAVGYVSRTSGRAAPWEWVQGTLAHSVPLRARVSADNAETYIACALAGLGLIQVPRFDVAHHLEAGELVEVMPDACAAPMPVHLIYPHRKHLSRRVQAFFAWMEELVRPHAVPGS